MSIEKIKELAKLVDELEALDNRYQTLAKEFDKIDANKKRV